MAFSKVGLPASSNPLVNDLVTSLFDEESANNPFAFKPPLPAQWDWSNPHAQTKTSLPALSGENIWKPQSQAQNCQNMHLNAQNPREIQTYVPSPCAHNLNQQPHSSMYLQSQYFNGNSHYSHYDHLNTSQDAAHSFSVPNMPYRQEKSQLYSNEPKFFGPRPNQAPHLLQAGRPCWTYLPQSSLDISLESASSSDPRSTSLDQAYDSHLLLAKLGKLFPGRTLDDLAHIPVEVIAQQLEATRFLITPNNAPPSNYRLPPPSFQNRMDPRLLHRNGGTPPVALQCSSPVELRNGTPPMFFADSQAKDYYDEVRLYPCDADLAQSVHEKQLRDVDQEKDSARCKTNVVRLLHVCGEQLRDLSCERQGRVHDSNVGAPLQINLHALVVEALVEYEKLVDFSRRLKESNLTSAFAEDLRIWEYVLQKLNRYLKMSKAETPIRILECLLRVFAKWTAKLRGLLYEMELQQLQAAERSHYLQLWKRFIDKENNF